MKKLIILGIATLSTGIVLSSTRQKKNVTIKPLTLEVQKSIINNNNAHTVNNLSTAD